MLNVAHYGRHWAIRRPDDFHDIEADPVRPGAETAQVLSGGASERPPLAPVHGRDGPAEILGPAGLDLHENEGFRRGRACHDIQFAPGAEADVAAQNPVAAALKESGGHLFAPRAGVLGFGAGRILPER